MARMVGSLRYLPYFLRDIWSTQGTYEVEKNQDENKTLSLGCLFGSLQLGE